MAEVSHFDRLRRDFVHVLEDLLLTWPMEDDIAYIREYLDQDEYGEALENLIAVGLHNGVGFNADQVRSVEAIASTIGIGMIPE